MRLSFSGNNKSIINIRSVLITLGVMLLAGIVFSVVQITIASSNPNPGHLLSQIQDFTCGAGYCLQSLTNGSTYCVACSGGGGGITGSGTANYVSKWTGSSSIGNSTIQDNGGGVGVGGAPAETSPGSGIYWPLHVVGAIHSSYDINADSRVRGANLCIGGSPGTNDGCRASWPALSCTPRTGQNTKAAGSGYSIVATVSCLAGETVTGGGCNCYGAGGVERFIMESFPSGSSWYCGCQNDDQNTWEIIMDKYVVCCKVL